jgi:hypothetical protein
LEFHQRLIQLTLGAKSPALIYVVLSCVKTQTSSGKLAGDIGWVLAKCFFGKGQGLVPILVQFGGPALGEQLVAFAGFGLGDCPASDRGCEQKHRDFC